MACASAQPTRMNIEFRRAVVSREIRSLIAFDRKAFHDYPADWFDQEAWAACDPWWMIVDRRKVGCCGFVPRVDFRGDAHRSDESPRLRDSLYIVTTGILPRYRGRGFGNLLKSWQVVYARQHGFRRILTNSRKSNRPMIRLNRTFGFKILRTTPSYYDHPREATVVMELRLS